MLRRLQLISLSILTALLLSVSNAAAAPVLFDIAGPGATGVDTSPGTDVSLTALVGGTILDLNVFVEITGDHMEDLDLFLTSPGGTTVHFRRNFWSPFIHQDGPLLATFDDEALAAHDSQGDPPIGVFQPFQALSAFDGQQLAGIWTLTIFDGFFFFEDDELVSWSISGTADQVLVPEPATLVLLGGGVAAWLARRRRRNDPATATS